MQAAVITHVYNEAVNLPLWVQYYGQIFGRASLYVFDHGSTDGSASKFDDVNVFRVAHTPFDDVKKSATVSAIHHALLQHYDCAIVTDCDEFIVPDPAVYRDLADYIDKCRPVIATCLGLHLHHILTHEFPIELDLQILSQRRYARFTRQATKSLISSVPTKWNPGAHVSNVKPVFDPNLFVFHIKYMDYNIAMKRHALNVNNVWSEAQQSSGHGMHHRHSVDRFVREGFLEPTNAIVTGRLQQFDFHKEISAMTEGVKERNGIFFLGDAIPKFVEIPDRFKACF